MGGSTIVKQGSSGCSCLLDRYLPECGFDQEEFPGTDAICTARNGDIFTDNKIPALPATNHFDSQTEEVNILELWFSLNEKEKEEFGMVFSRMVVKFFYLLTKMENR